MQQQQQQQLLTIIIALMACLCVVHLFAIMGSTKIGAGHGAPSPDGGATAGALRARARQ
jgi:hypothetical protein